MGDKAKQRGWRDLIAAAARRARFAQWRLRGRLQRRFILLAHPEIRCAPDVTIDPGVRMASFDGGRIEIGRGTTIATRAIIIAEGGTIRIGSNCHIGTGTTIHAKAGVEIGDDALIAEYVAIRDHDHATADPSRPYRVQGFVTAPVRLGRNVWLGTKATVLKGAMVGDNAVIGANAVVTRAVPAATIAAGVPARPLRPLSPGRSASAGTAEGQGIVADFAPLIERLDR